MKRKPSTPPRLTARELLSRNMLQFRRAHGWSQEDLSFESGLHRTFIAQVEGMKRNISLDNVQRIADALRVSMSELFGAP